MTTLAAHDFDVDSRSGFMPPPPPDPPIARLSKQWEPWEIVLEHPVKEKLQLTIRWDPSEDAEKSAIGVRKSER